MLAKVSLREIGTQAIEIYWPRVRSYCFSALQTALLNTIARLGSLTASGAHTRCVFWLHDAEKE